MKPFNAGAFRRAIDAAQSGAANDLVRQTLSQNGLLPSGPGGGGQFNLPSMSDLLAGHIGGSAAPAALVPGASFEADHFACDAGGRDYLTYIPASASDGATGIIMMLHGCTQTHADFATGTGMNDLAEQNGFIVVYPQQARGENSQSCWNWFSPGDQRRERGEPAILAGLASHLARLHDVPPERTFVAGLSAGAAMAVILGQTHGDVFAAVGTHSGLPFGSAQDLPSAFAAMAGTGGADLARRPKARPARTIIFHGSADHTVHPANGERIAADILAAGPAQTLVEKESGQVKGRRFSRETTTTVDGKSILETWTIDGLGHAWSGGRPGGSYTDPAGPDASAEMVRFFLELNSEN